MVLTDAIIVAAERGEVAAISPHFGGLNGDESNSEDAQRGRELRCTYGLAAVREEQERWLASINRQCWASFDPSGEIREAARSFKNL